MDSKYYRDIEQGFREELSRVEGNTKVHQSELDALREEHLYAVLERFKTQMEVFERERERIEGEEGEFSEYYQDLGKRYKSKKSLLERDEKKVNGELNGEIEDETGDGGSIRSRRATNIINAEHLRIAIRKEEEEIAGIELEENELPDRYRKIEESDVKRFNQLTKNENGEIERIEKEQGELSGNLESEEAILQREFIAEEERLENEFEELRKQVDETIKSRVGSGNTELHSRIRGLLEARDLLNDIEKIQLDNKRNRTAWEYFKNATYQNWV